MPKNLADKPNLIKLFYNCLICAVLTNIPKKRRGAPSKKVKAQEVGAALQLCV